MSQSGRPVSGFVRPGTQSGRPGTMEQAIKTPRTAHTARPVTRFVLCFFFKAFNVSSLRVFIIEQILLPILFCYLSESHYNSKTEFMLFICM